MKGVHEVNEIAGSGNDGSCINCAMGFLGK